ncbi:NAD(P)/FAD-dependent oxidoreductase [Flavobacterium paronense]|uniref:NAD(P)/FAD-dependent oxidoreductase n=1 Tax=Flavobacterium paronense TaxID=1392775 RepID=A0ABV5GBS0_9FLAO|nr:NAD(P)/FAD-dependent oxidoreductase [Flavobacterium paronense]MDN3677592.1 NAD(P)/FAD-dependent oxidoreductase [Flavobacterium paronense]
MESKEVIILGGGLAGLTAAIHLLKLDCKVLLFEKNEFPKHKVCGEYISNEVLPYLQSLALNLETLHPKKISKLNFSLVSGKTIKANLPLGGVGVSRFALDYYLYQEVLKRGGKIVQETVSNVVFLEDKFRVTTNNSVFCAKVVLGAFGKRSNLDVVLKRNFISKPSNWLGVKAHYKVNFADDVVGLHHFNGGYCGVSKVETDLVNICYLGNYETFKKYKSITAYQENVVCKNPNLKAIFTDAIIQFETPLTISQISFEPKKSVENKMLMIGDTAGLIHPLCGNGMAMAIHSAKLASESVINFFEGRCSRTEMERQYSKLWRKNFANRIQTGRLLGNLLQKEKLANVVLTIVTTIPFLLPLLIKKTHGRPL